VSAVMLIEEWPRIFETNAMLLERLQPENE
jgi:hypothetical protein